jgi:hypothetical protein
MKHKLLKVIRSHYFKSRVHTRLELSFMPKFGGNVFWIFRVSCQHFGVIFPVIS